MEPIPTTVYAQLKARQKIPSPKLFRGIQWIGWALVAVSLGLFALVHLLGLPCFLGGFGLGFVAICELTIETPSTPALGRAKTASELEQEAINNRLNMQQSKIEFLERKLEEAARWAELDALPSTPPTP